MATLTKKATVKATARRVTKKVTATSSTINHVFSDGTKFTGTLEQLEKVASALGLKITGLENTPKGFYVSESKGLVRISEMNDFHIRRALLKRSKDYYTEVFAKEDTNRQFLKKFTGLTEDQIVIDLYNELSKRI
jgi:hypothetical protein